MRKGLIRLFLLVISLLSLTLLTSCGGGGGGGKGPSGPPNNTPPVSDQPSEPQVPSEWVQGVKATVMEHPKKIMLSWEKRAEENVTYKVYRYESKAADAAFVEFSGIQGNSFDDTTPIIDTPYYYRVTWVKDGIEYGEEASLVVGLCRVDIDNSEPNDVLVDADKLTAGISLDAYTFAFDDGIGGNTVDTDWYCCENTSEMDAISITIDLREVTGDIKINYYDKQGKCQELYDEIPLTVLPGDTMYFKIEPVDGDGFGKYQITFTDYID